MNPEPEICTMTQKQTKATRDFFATDSIQIAAYERDLRIEYVFTNHDTAKRNWTYRAHEAGKKKVEIIETRISTVAPCPDAS